MLEPTSLRTVGCGDLRETHVGQKVYLCGWVQRVRDLGGVVFVDLRDRSGWSQIVFREEVVPHLMEMASHLRTESVIRVEGEVVKRTPDTVNPSIPTGTVEVVVRNCDVLNETETLPFQVQDDTSAGEVIRLRHRYLDLRRPVMQRNLEVRHRVILAVRNYLSERGFLEIETPILTRSTPEGARDFLVPSRLHPGKFYALPQSPQLFKQILMVSGFDRYFQIARCFRDEDLRADRQPEFTQIDIEMSFVEEEDVLRLTEDLIIHMFEVVGISLPHPFPRMSFQQAMEQYGTDRPDLRYPHQLSRLDNVFKSSDFKILKNAADDEKSVVLGLRIPGGDAWPRNRIDQLTEYVRQLGAPGLIWFRFQESGEVQSPVLKFLRKDELEHLRQASSCENGDLLVLMAGPWEPTCIRMGAVRQWVAEVESWIPEETRWSPVWIVDFPLLEWDEEEERWVARHHPFTQPVESDLEGVPPESIKARAYDLVLNGVEIGGGSIRNHRIDFQMKIFEFLKIPPEEAQAKFGFLLDALRYGAPPHGGIALGLDRIIMMMTGASSIRDVIAFPKTASGQCLMTGSPAPVDEKQLDELHIRIKMS